MKGGYSEKIVINEEQEDHFCSMGYLDLAEYHQNKTWGISMAVLGMLEINLYHKAE